MAHNKQHLQLSCIIHAKTFVKNNSIKQSPGDPQAPTQDQGSNKLKSTLIVPWEFLGSGSELLILECVD